MDQTPTPATGTLLLERPAERCSSVPRPGPATSRPGPLADRRSGARSGADTGAGVGAGVGHHVVVELLPFSRGAHPLRSPALAALAAAAILEGYGHLGLLATSGRSALLVGPLASLLFTVLASVSALALTRPRPSGTRRRTEAILLAAGGLATATAIAAVGAVAAAAGSASTSAGPSVSGTALAGGAADLLFALVAVVLVVAEERRRFSRR